MKFVKKNNRILYYSDRSDKKLKQLLSYLILNNEYYKHLMCDIDYENKSIEEYYFFLPESNKDVIKKNSMNYLSLCNSQIMHEITSGSSGNPFTCYKTVLERIKYANILWKRRKRIDSCININNFMSVFGNINISSDIDFTVTTDVNMKKIIEYIKEKEIRWISGSPSILLAYAQFVNKNKETLDTVKYIELQGEGVDKYERKFIEEAMNAKTIIHYGMREFWTIAYECKNHKMHFLDSDFIFEQDLITGELFVTSLISKYMPFVRYATGDKVEIQYLEQCSCGICDSYIMKIHNGRRANSIYGHNGEIGDIVFKRVIHRVICKFEKNANIIRRYSVEQIKKDKFVFYIDKGEDYDLIIENINPSSSGKISIFRKNIKY